MRAIKGVFCNRIVGYLIDSRMKPRIGVYVLKALSSAAVMLLDGSRIPTQDRRFAATSASAR